MPFEPARCRDVIEEFLADPTVVSLAHHVHIDQCVHCRTELETHRSLRAALRGLRNEHIEPPRELFADVVGELRRVAASPARRLARVVRVAPYVGGVIAAGAAGAVLAGRSRRARLGLA